MKKILGYCHRLTSVLALTTGIKDVLKQGYQKMERLKPTRAKLKRKNLFSNNLGETTLSIALPPPSFRKQFGSMCPLPRVHFSLVPDRWPSIRIKLPSGRYSISKSQTSSLSSVFASVNSRRAIITQLHRLPSTTPCRPQSCG